MREGLVGKKCILQGKRIRWEYEVDLRGEEASFAGKNSDIDIISRGDFSH